MDMSITDRLVHNTVRIECLNEEGEKSSGTGFFFNFCEVEHGRHVPAVVTNKHVIEGANIGLFLLNIGNDSGEPLYGQHVPVEVEYFEQGCVSHPDPSVDLVAYPIAPIIELARQNGKKIFGIMHLTNRASRPRLGLTSEACHEPDRRFQAD
jgi:hypothetical protein